jgi:AcrR family transcriptional regulator
LAAALQLFVAFGFHGTPTSRIAAQAGVSNGTLFHYYKTKQNWSLPSTITSKPTWALTWLPRMGGPDSLETRFKKARPFPVLGP